MIGLFIIRIFQKIEAKGCLVKQKSVYENELLVDWMISRGALLVSNYK